MASATRISAPTSWWDSIFSDKFGADGGAPRAALDMYPRQRGKPADAPKSPEKIERNAWRIAAPTNPGKNQQYNFTLHPSHHR